MSQALPQPGNCGDSCPTVTNTQIVGPPGTDGEAGSTGSDGVSSFAYTTASFTMPAELANVTVAVTNSSWAVVGQIVFVQNAGYFSVSSKPTLQSITLTNLGYTDNAAPSTVIALLQQIGPAGVEGSSVAVVSTIEGDRIRLAQETLTYAATVNIDFDGKSYQTINLTGNLTLTTSNLTTAGGFVKNVVVVLVADGSSRNLTFPGTWKFEGAAAPTAIAANKTGVLSLTNFGTTDATILASYAAQP